MLGRQERAALLILVGVAAIVVITHLALTAAGKQPFAHPFTVNTEDGELVYLDGTVDQAAITKNGGHVTLRIRNMTVFIPEQAARGQSFQKGQNVSVYGIVETYRGEKEIVVNSAGDIRFR
jgi:DNA/RNA endonuclease YhcR with UshA esterase domain